jgi:hypothetical protein
MSGHACSCQPRRVRVLHRNQRRSAFDGYRVKWSPASTVQCRACGRTWRSQAAYVQAAPDAPPDWAERAFVPEPPEKESAP